ncbi:hypothetical protein Moror_7064 [Moniliophthora roreri MCA 2997]|uniref:Uncharacterized protein n=1 Tax=Moniliophthora roreri (strain MCA 2997) TaxID=1381753 RepID=V2XAR7_MONRO|nr:hypothetical protein Moror_7064 [Moniliophthora roreri MCA 2997]
MSGAPYVSILDGWNHLARRENLIRGTDEYKQRKKEYISTRVLHDFLAHFGGDPESLEAWRGICQVTGVKNVTNLTTIRMCRSALEKKHCNIIDLVDAANTGGKARTFKTRRALAHYTMETEKYFPKDAAKGVPLLEEFLVEVFKSYTRR